MGRTFSQFVLPTHIPLDTHSLTHQLTELYSHSSLQKSLISSFTDDSSTHSISSEQPFRVLLTFLLLLLNAEKEDPAQPLQVSCFSHSTLLLHPLLARRLRTRGDQFLSSSMRSTLSVPSTKAQIPSLAVHSRLHFCHLHFLSHTSHSRSLMASLLSSALPIHSHALSSSAVNRIRTLSHIQ